jgi:4a-hydroxytetrahydrobiopterin dehydratase
MQPIKNDELSQALRQLDVNWSAIPGKGLIRIVPTDSFTTGFALVAKIAGLADQHNHHPELTLRTNEIEITLITHAVGDITRADLLLAKDIDKLLEAKP